MSRDKPVILYVDDDPDYRFAMRQLVEANGMTLVEAGDCDEGLRACKDAAPDLIILDLMMEEVDSGVSLLRRLRAEGLSAPVWLLSSMGDAMAMTTDSADLGFVGVLQKPIDERALRSITRSLAR
jgi:CheY-like chemotaxis protein